MNINNVGKKIENPKLVEAMRAIREEENDATRAEFFKEIVKTVLIVPAKFDKEPKADEDGKIVIDGGVKVNFTLLTNEKNEHVLPCFTDDETIDATQFKDDFKRVVISYKEISELVIKSNGQIRGMAINPFTENCFVPVEFMKDVKARMNNNLKQTKLAPGAKIKLRTPKYPPVDMLDAATECLKVHSEVTKAYLQMMEEEGKEDKYLIALEMTGDEKPILSKLIPVMKPHSFGIELAFATTDNPLGMKVAEIAEPFYERKE